jgi:hypothetical protein
MSAAAGPGSRFSSGRETSAGGSQATHKVRKVRKLFIGLPATVIGPYAKPAEKLDDARVIIDHEIGKRGNSAPGEPGLKIAERLLVDARNEIPESGPVHFTRADSPARPNVDVVAVRHQPLED